MDTKFNTIHIVAEMAIISGMFYYFNKRIKTLESEMAHIKKTYVDTFDDVYKKIELVKTGILQLQTTEEILKSSKSSNSSNSATIPQSFFRQADVNRNYENVTQKSSTPFNETTKSISNPTNINTNNEIKKGQEVLERVENNNQEKVVGSYIKIEVPNVASQLINNVQNVSSDIFDFFQGSTPQQRTSAKVEVIEDDEDIKKDEIDDKNDLNVANEKTEPENDEELNEDDLREIDSILLKDKKDKKDK